MISRFFNRPIFQYAFVVNDLQASAERWASLFGAGPFFLEPHHVLQDGSFRYRDGTEQCDVSYAFAYSGPVQIQLICQHDDKPSIFREMFAPGEEGFHHVAILADKFTEDKAALSAMSMVAAVEMAEPSLDAPHRHYEVAYFDARAMISCFVELYAASVIPLEAFARWKREHEAWDGTGPVLRSQRA